MDTIKVLKIIDQKLPKIIRNPLRKLYYMWNTRVELSDSIIEDIREYFSLDRKETMWLLKSGGRLNSDLWVIANPRTDKEKMDFYENTPFYIFDLAWWHMTRFQRVFRERIFKYAKGDVLDYGGGIGDFSIKITENGFNTDYADVGGKTFNFAKWLFQKKGAHIMMTDLTKETISKNYDAIFAIDVIEHVPNSKEVIQNLAAHLKSKGNLIVTGLKINEESQIHPMHQKVNFDENYLETLGLLTTDKPWLFHKK
jgi:SAM-dependent methyltransferase